MKTFIQVDNNNIPLFDAGFAMYEYCASRDISYQFLKTYDLPDSKSIFCGSVEMTRSFIKKFIKNFEFIPTYPDELKPYYERVIEKITLDKYNVEQFIKPVKSKLFNGGVKSKYEILNEIIHKIDDEGDVECYTSPVIDIISEFRCFIYKNKLEGIQYYSGEIIPFPHISFINKVIEVYTSAPIAYCIDIGVLKNGLNAVIEVNDLLASGTYGFEYKLWDMYNDRFLEIFKGI